MAVSNVKLKKLEESQQSVYVSGQNTCDRQVHVLLYKIQERV